MIWSKLLKSDSVGFRSNKTNDYHLSELSLELGRKIQERVESVLSNTKISAIKELDNITFSSLDDKNDLAIDLDFLWQNEDYKLHLAFKISQDDHDRAHPIPVLLIKHNRNQSVAIINYDVFKDMEEIGLEKKEANEYLENLITSSLESFKLYVTQVNKKMFEQILFEALTQIAIINNSNFTKQLG